MFRDEHELRAIAADVFRSYAEAQSQNLRYSRGISGEGATADEERQDHQRLPRWDAHFAWLTLFGVAPSRRVERQLFGDAELRRTRHCIPPPQPQTRAPSRIAELPSPPTTTVPGRDEQPSPVDSHSDASRSGSARPGTLHESPRPDADTSLNGEGWANTCGARGHGGISMREFCDVVVAEAPRHSVVNAGWALFDALDQQGRGYISQRDLQRAVKQSLPHVSADAVAATFGLLDADRDGRILFEDFEALLPHKPRQD